MPYFEYHNQKLYAERVALEQIAASYDTPCYVYSQKTIEENWHSFDKAFKQQQRPYKIFYAIKANSNLAILRLLSKLGAGFDAVSGGELERVLAAGGDAKSIIFSGVGKTTAEITRAIDLGIHSINIESEAELLRVQEIAQKLNKKINIALRINPDISANSHPYMSTGGKENKFGVDYTQAINLYKLAASLSNLTIKGISCHIGSQITTLEPFMNVIQQLLAIIASLAENDIKLEYLDIGGGLGICYKDETPPTPQQYVKAICDKLKDCPLEVHIEPGRSIVASAGVLLTKVEYLKTTAENNFAITDAAMNDLMRPALYDSYHEILPVSLSKSQAEQKYSVVGPVCESGDFLAKNRLLSLKQDDLLAINTCGAYGFSMSSNYNTRPRCAEILVNGENVQLIRKRETIAQLLENELI